MLATPENDRFYICIVYIWIFIAVFLASFGVDLNKNIVRDFEALRTKL
jgi:hypothetical protein